MRIDRVTAHAVTFAFVSGGFATSYGRRTRLANLLIAVEAGGETGYGEVCQATGATPPPLDPASLEEARAALGRLVGGQADDVAGCRERLGPARGNVLCAVETALWNLMARRAGMPLLALLGGRGSSAMHAYASLSSGDAETMAREVEVVRQQGVVRFQVKLDGDVESDVARIRAVCRSLRRGETVLADANGAYVVAGAMGLMAATRGCDVAFEEPCRTLAQNLELARACDRPVVLDQCLDAPQHYAEAIAAGVAAGVGIKPTILGGLGAARTVRDLCIAAGIAMKVDDSWAADVGSVAALHLAAGVPEPLLLSTLDMRDYFDGRMFAGGPTTRDGRIAVPDDPGLGLVALPDRFGPALFAVA